MRSTTFNVSFSKQLLRAIDAVARQEARTRSELLREAARAYVENKKRWQNIFAFGNRQAKKLGVKQSDIERRIADYRRQNSDNR